MISILEINIEYLNYNQTSAMTMPVCGARLQSLSSGTCDDIEKLEMPAKWLTFNGRMAKYRQSCKKNILFLPQLIVCTVTLSIR
jgi:hypothetical protein